MKHKKRTSVMLFVISIFMVIFGIFWTVFTFLYGGNPFMQNKVPMYEWLFILGLIFVVLSFIQGIYHFRILMGLKKSPEQHPDKDSNISNINSDYVWKNVYCPYCGNVLNSDFVFCNKCGKKLP